MPLLTSGTRAVSYDPGYSNSVKTHLRKITNFRRFVVMSRILAKDVGLCSRLSTQMYRHQSSRSLYLNVSVHGRKSPSPPCAMSSVDMQSNQAKSSKTPVLSKAGEVLMPQRSVVEAP